MTPTPQQRRPIRACAFAVVIVWTAVGVASGQQYPHLLPPEPVPAEELALGMGPQSQAPLPLPPVQAASYENYALANADAPTSPPLPPSAGNYTPSSPSGSSSPSSSSNAEMSKRVADLEKRLSELTKQANAPKPAPTKPLITPTGRIQFDTANFNQNDTSLAQFGNVRNAVGFRRARIGLLGEYNQFDYLIEMDFANRDADAAINTKNQSTAFKDVYIQMRDLPWLGTIRVGHFRECFGLEELTSDNYTTFMERSINDEGAFVPGRNNGVMTFNWTENQRATWAAGVFTNQTGFDQPPLAQYDHMGVDAAARVTFLPWYDEASGGRGLWHTGLDYVYRGAPDNQATFLARPEASFGPNVINLRFTDVNHWQVMDVENALVYGPLSVQSEVFATSVDHIGGTTNNFYGTYAYVSYFLTGEHRPYNRKMGVFDRVKPFEDFFHVRTRDGNVATGMGAWEIGYRFSYIDCLDDLTRIGAGRAADHTIGLNWYMNPYTRMMFDYVHSTDTYNVQTNQRLYGGAIDAFMVRCAMDF